MRGQQPDADAVGCSTPCPRPSIAVKGTAPLCERRDAMCRRRASLSHSASVRRVPSSSRVGPHDDQALKICARILPKQFWQRPSPALPGVTRPCPVACSSASVSSRRRVLATSAASSVVDVVGEVVQVGARSVSAR